MTTKKLNLIGGYTLMVTLPKDWVAKNSLDKNSMVEVITDAAGNVVVKPIKNDQPQ